MRTIGNILLVYIWRIAGRTGLGFCRMHMVYYNYWNSVWKAVFQVWQDSHSCHLVRV